MCHGCDVYETRRRHRRVGHVLLFDAARPTARTRELGWADKEMKHREKGSNRVVGLGVGKRRNNRADEKRGIIVSLPILTPGTAAGQKRNKSGTEIKVSILQRCSLPK